MQPAHRVGQQPGHGEGGKGGTFKLKSLEEHPQCAAELLKAGIPAPSGMKPVAPRQGAEEGEFSWQVQQLLEDLALLSHAAQQRRD